MTAVMGKRQDVDRGYAWFVLGAAFTVTFMGGMIVYSAGVVNTAFLDEVDSDISRTSWIGSSMLGTFTLSGPLAGLFTKAVGYRVSCMCGGICILVGMFIASFLHDIIGLVITYGIVTGIGIGLAYNAACVVPGFYFLKKRSLAFGVTVCGAAMGMFAGGPLCQMLIDRYQLSGCLLILGAISSNTCVAACLLRPATNPADDIESINEKKDCEHTGSTTGIYVHKRLLLKELQDVRSVKDAENGACTAASLPNDTSQEQSSLLKQVKHYEYEPDGKSPNYFTEDKNTRRSESCCGLQQAGDLFRKVKRIKIINKYGFLCYCVSILLWTTGEGACLFHLPNYAQKRGSTPSQAASLFTVMGVSSLLSRLLTGCAASDSSVGNLLLHVGLIGMVGVMTLLFPFFSHSYPLQMVFSAVYGLYSGGPNTLMSPMAIDLVGLENLAVGFGIESFFCGVAFLLGPPCASWIYTATENYDYTFVFAGGVLLCGAFSGAIMTVFPSVPASKPDSPVELIVD